MIEKVDRYLASMWSKPLKLLCKATGKNNFFFARLLVWAMVTLSLPFTLLLILQEHARFYPLSGLAFFLGWLAGGHTTALRLLEQDIERGSTAIRKTSLTNPEASRTRLISLMNALFWVSFAPTVYGLYCFGGAILMDHIARYWAIDIQPPRKSWARRALDWIKAHRPQFAPVHPPPFPVPG